MTSRASLHFHNGKKALVKIIFGRKFFIYELIFKIFVALFRTFGMQNDDMIIFC